MNQPEIEKFPPPLPEDVAYEHVLRFVVTTVCPCGAKFTDRDFQLDVAQSNARYKMTEHRKLFHA